jgi:hypothetical protein
VVVRCCVQSQLREVAEREHRIDELSDLR